MGEKLLRVKKFFTFYVFLPVILDIVIESLNRKSVFSAFSYMVDKPFLFDQQRDQCIWSLSDCI